MTAPPYIINTQHRDGNPNKSQWSIPTVAEQASFVLAFNRGWLLGDTGWSYHVREKTIDYLGLAVDRSRKLVVAKFVASSNPVIWHGYPADHEKHQHDVPPLLIRQQWIVEEIIPPQKVRKIGKQQPCRL